MAESLGKNQKGFMPVISSAPKDHHSLLQLYLDGPKDKIFYIFSAKQSKKTKLNFNIFDERTDYLNKKNYNDIKRSQKDAFIEVLKRNKTPFREIVVKKFDEDNLGKLYLSFIFETISLGKIFNLDPFDQPAVEEVKSLTKRFLKLRKLSKKNL